MVNKKGQTALEYLLTYGWAILIIIIVGAALYALGVFSPGTFTGKRSTGFSQFQMADFKVGTNGADTQLTVVYGNRLGKTVTIDKIIGTYKNHECNITVGTSLGPNVQVSKVLNCTSAWGGNLDLKSTYQVAIDFYYTDPDSTLSHIDSGTLFGAVEAS